MRVVGERSIASFIRIVLEAAWWLAVVGLALLAGLLVASFCFNVRGNNLTMDLPVAIKPTAPATGVDASATNGQIEKMRGNLRFPVRSNQFLSFSLFFSVLLLGGLLWVVTQLRQIFRSLSRGQLFLPENTRRIRWVGFTITVGELARSGIVYLFSYYASGRFTANGLHFAAVVDVSGVTILSGLAILVIAEVFREGTRLQQEQALTI